MPGDTITKWEWSFDGVTYQVLTATPNVTTVFENRNPGGYNVFLRVTDNTANSYPSSGQPNLTSTDTAQVYVRAVGAAECAACPTNLRAVPKVVRVELNWTYRQGAVRYNVYRAAAAGGPYDLIGIANVGVYHDTNVRVGSRYYYTVREVGANGVPVCTSNEATALVTAR
jgi:predicted phage tail protein